MRADVGAYFQYAFVSINTDWNPDCTSGVNCSAHDIRVGANIHYHVHPAATFDPWIGAGMGYEVHAESTSGLCLAFGGSIIFSC